MTLVESFGRILDIESIAGKLVKDETWQNRRQSGQTPNDIVAGIIKQHYGEAFETFLPEQLSTLIEDVRHCAAHTSK